MEMLGGEVDFSVDGLMRCFEAEFTLAFCVYVYHHCVYEDPVIYGEMDVDFEANGRQF